MFGGVLLSSPRIFEGAVSASPRIYEPLTRTRTQCGALQLVAPPVDGVQTADGPLALLVRAAPRFVEGRTEVWTEREPPINEYVANARAEE